MRQSIAVVTGRGSRKSISLAFACNDSLFPTRHSRPSTYPCISLLISGEISSSNTPAPASSQQPKVKPDSAELAVMPLAPLIELASKPDRLPPTASVRSQPPIAAPTSRGGASLVTIDRLIGDRHNSPTVCSTIASGLTDGNQLIGNSQRLRLRSTM